MKKKTASIPVRVLTSPALSIEAKGLLAILAALPSNWEYRSSVIQKQSGMGRNRYQRIMREIKAAGEVEIHYKRKPNGEIISRTFVLFPKDKPAQSISPDSRLMVVDPKAPIWGQLLSKKEEAENEDGDGSGGSAPFPPLRLVVGGAPC